MQPASDGAARVRIVHGLSDAGPLDVYVDGALALIGIVFGETSANLDLAGGDHQFAVAETGSPLDAAIAEGTIALKSDASYYAPLLGSVGDASVGLFEIDERPLPQGRSRFRVISGIVDAEAIVPTFSGGDALSEPLGFGDVSAYAAVDAGTYDLDILDAASGASLLALPQTPFREGAAIDILLVGQIADASLTALLESAPVTVERPTGFAAQIVEGSCDRAQTVTADLGVIQPGQGEAVGAGTPPPVAQGYALAVAPFATLVASPHAVIISSGPLSAGTVIACGEIAGRLTDTGSLVIALHDEGTGEAQGIAVLAPGLEDPETTGVSVFLIAEGPAQGLAATPQPASG